MQKLVVTIIIILNIEQFPINKLNVCTEQYLRLYGLKYCADLNLVPESDVLSLRECR